MLVLSLLVACDEAPGEFNSYDPDAVEIAEPADMAPAADEAMEERRRGSFGAASTAVPLNPPPGTSWPVAGLSPKSMGRWVFPGRQVGIQSGLAACQAVFSGSHLCSVEELLLSEDRGAFDGLSPRELWVADPSVNPTGGANDNCAGLTYEGADARWRGLSVAWAVNPVVGAPELMIRTVSGGTTSADCLVDLSACAGEVPSKSECNVQRPIACCR